VPRFIVGDVPWQTTWLVRIAQPADSAVKVMEIKPVTDDARPIHPFQQELDTAIATAKAAGTRILEFYGDMSATEYEKNDGSPVTDADLAADQIIREGIGLAFPDDAIMTEEGADDLERLENRRCWIVDPLDGTAQFINRTGEFDVMIALVEDELPVVAVMYQPTTNLLHFATRDGGAWVVDDSGTRRVSMHRIGDPPVVAASKYYGGFELPNTFGRIAASVGAEQPDILDVGYQPRRVMEPTWVFDAFVGLWAPDGTRFAREWDLAPPDLFTTEAGGIFSDALGKPYRYNQRETQINRGLVAANDRELHGAIIEAIRRELPLEDND
jgi:3'-phosphoadenosine 5'-phosphosulfate (PAPS) 3'-phosphatase